MSQALTLREAYELHYDKSELRERTIRKTKHYFNAWERHTSNPAVTEITNETMEGFRAACLAAGLSASSINSYRRQLRAILRRLAPEGHGNPRGLGIIERVPYMRPVKTSRKRPYRIPQDDFTRFYVIGAKTMQNPRRTGLPPADWWRTLIVMAYATGLRRSDLLSIRFSDVDWNEKALAVDPSKTGKQDWFPLTDWALAHLDRARRPNAEFVFGGYGRSGGGSGGFPKQWQNIVKRSGVSRYFTLQDVRRTAASEIERVGRGLGKVFLQHAPRDVSEAFYLSADDELREAVEKMRVPVGFNAGPRVAERVDKEEQQKALTKRREALRINPDDFDTKLGANPADWQFTENGYCFKGTWHRLNPRLVIMLRVLVESEGHVTNSQFCEALAEHCNWTRDKVHQVSVEIARLRKRLRADLGIVNGWDPLPVETYGITGAWTLHIPRWLSDGESAGKSQQSKSKRQAG